MAVRTLRCEIEEIAAWHPQLFLEPHIVACAAVMSRYSESPARFEVECQGIASRHIVACAAVMSRYSESPARFEVECQGIASRWLGRAKRFGLEMSWAEETANKANRLRHTMQPKPLVEMAAVALAMVLVHRVAPLGQLDVTAYGERADYRSLGASTVLEISGTETIAELDRRHREKTAQALANSLRWDACVVVCAFASEGHRIRFSGHRWEEA